jgi:hypothetical protein
MVVTMVPRPRATRRTKLSKMMGPRRNTRAFSRVIADGGGKESLPRGPPEGGVEDDGLEAEGGGEGGELLCEEEEGVSLKLRPKAEVGGAVLRKMSERREVGFSKIEEGERRIC